MAIFWTILLFALAASAVLLRPYGRDMLDGEDLGRLKPLYPFGLWWADRLGPLLREQERQELAWTQAVYVREDAEKRLRLSMAKRAVIFWCGLFAASLLGLAVSLLPPAGEEVDSLERPAFGSTQSYTLEVSLPEAGEGTAGSKPQTVSVEIDGQEPTADGMAEVFDEAFHNLQREVLSGNASLDEVRTDLSLPSTADYGIRVAWESMDPAWINGFGHITAEEIPKEGVVVVLRATMTYAGYAFTYDMPLRLLPKEEGQETFIALFLKEMEKRNGADRTGKSVALPGSLQGQSLTVRLHRGRPMLALVLLIPACAAFLAISERQRLKEAYGKRKRELQAAYPGFVFELGIMLRCGMTMRTAWSRMLEAQERMDGSGNGAGYLHEEMLLTRNEIDAGMGEGSAYAAFGRRCGDYCYIRLGAQLEQNLKQGIAGLCDMLTQELSRALEDRKNGMLEAGERMETKMLFPMFLLLGLVMAVLMVPAFMEL